MSRQSLRITRTATTSTLLSAGLLGLGMLAAGTAAAQSKAPPEKKIYCWEDGNRKTCSDVLPAKATDNARTEFSAKTGATIKQVGRALTDAERSTALQAAEAARREAQAQAREKRHDLAMIDSYPTEADLRRAYAERTELLDETLKSSKLGIANLRLSLLSLLRQAGDLEIAGAPMTRKLTSNIQQQHAELLRQQQIMAAQQEDRSALEKELQESLQRYRAMKQGKDTAAPAAASPQQS